MGITSFFGSAKGKGSGFYLMTVGNLLAIVLSLYRQMEIARIFGMSWQTDVFAIALVLPLLIREAVVHTIDATLVPAYTKIMTRNGARSAKAFLNRVITWLSVASGLLCLLLLAASGKLISLISPGLIASQIDLAARMFRILVPMILLSTLSGILISICNFQRRYGLTALIRILEVGTSLVFILLFSGVMGIMVLPYSILTGAASLLVALVFISRKISISFNPDMGTKDPEFRKFVLVALPLVLGALVLGGATVVDKAMASLLGEDSITSLDYASKIHNTLLTILILPMAIIANVSFADFFARRDMTGLKDEFGKLLNWITVITLPVTAAMVVLSTPLISVLFQRGEFSQMDARMVGGVLMFYAPWFVGFSVCTLLSRIFYSMQDSVTPVALGFWGMIVNILLNMMLMGSMGVNGLALGTSIASLARAVLLLYFLRGRIGAMNGKVVAREMLKVAGGALVMIAVMLGLDRLFPFDTGNPLLHRVLYLAGFSLLGAVVYGFTLVTLRSIPARVMLERIKDRFSSK